ncbi:MAG: molybdenum cofactor biosynthesis protein MoaE [Actinomycetia bacterium]|nr:molybdenum cofactor biosynthesis protein MoaE [Actinomycetes bacterium]
MANAARVITCSDSVTVGSAEDRSGPLAAELLAAAGWSVDRVVVPDDQAQIAAGIRTAVADQKTVVVCTGGTGFGPRDVTPEAILDVCDRWIPGVGEAIRANARKAFPLTDLSRMGAGVVGQTVVVALPGSPGGVKDGLAVVLPLLSHLHKMLSGGGHETTHHGQSAGPKTRESTGATVASSVGRVSVAADLITPEAVTAAVRDAQSGAVATFEGRVRNHDADRDVVGLAYEAHPDAAHILADVCQQATQLAGVVRVAAVHRTGNLAVGDLAFCVAVSAPHRAEAYAALEWLVDTAKAKLPIWKRQLFADGRSEWVNCA